MHVLITGAAGMIGRKLTERLVKDGALNGQPIARLTRAGVVAPERPRGTSAQVETWATDIAMPGEAAKLIGSAPDVVFHLAAIVSGEAELDLGKGYRINLDGTRYLLDAVRGLGEMSA